jgi:hypothetical protein
MTGYPSKKAAAQAKLQCHELKRIKEILGAVTGFEDDDQQYVDDARDAIQKLIDSPPAQPAQGPVGKFAKFTDGIWREVTDGSPGVSLYTAPIQRKRDEALKLALDTLDEVRSETFRLLRNGLYAEEKVWSTIVDIKKALAQPAQERPWVGLTDDDIDEWTPEIHTVIRAIEAKLKEKNT